MNWLVIWSVQILLFYNIGIIENVNDYRMKYNKKPCFVCRAKHGFSLYGKYIYYDFTMEG